MTTNRTTTPVSVPNEQQRINNPATVAIDNITTEIEAFYLNYAPKQILLAAMNIVDHDGNSTYKIKLIVPNSQEL